MKAAVVTESGVQYKDAPKPEPKANEILISIAPTSRSHRAKPTDGSAAREPSSAWSAPAKSKRLAPR